MIVKKLHIVRKTSMVVMLLTFLSSPILAKEKDKDTIQRPHSISLQYVGMAFHPLGGTYPELYIRKLDPGAYFVLEIGGAIQYRYQFHKRWAFTSAFAYYSDCAVQMAGIFQVGIRFNIIASKKHKLNLAWGPALLFREDWHQLPGYISDKFFAESVHGNYQYRFYLVPDLEYSYTINDKWDAFFSVFPGGQHVSTLSIGGRFKW